MHDFNGWLFGKEQVKLKYSDPFHIQVMLSNYYHYNFLGLFQLKISCLKELTYFSITSNCH